MANQRTDARALLARVMDTAAAETAIVINAAFGGFIFSPFGSWLWVRRRVCGGGRTRLCAAPAALPGWWERSGCDLAVAAEQECEASGGEKRQQGRFPAPIPASLQAKGVEMAAETSEVSLSGRCSASELALSETGVALRSRAARARSSEDSRSEIGATLAARAFRAEVACGAADRRQRLQRLGAGLREARRPRPRRSSRRVSVCWLTWGLLPLSDSCLAGKAERGGG